jgi:transketolase
MRPADANETAAAWKVALERTDGPVALCLTRQGLPVMSETRSAAFEGVRQGGYVLADAEDLDVVIVATGSEVSLALSARTVLSEQGIGARVVSLPCWERFMATSADYRASVLPAGIPRVSVEAGTTFGWQAIVGLDGATVGIDRFGASAPGKVVATKLGINVDQVVDAARRLVAKT